MQKTKRKNTEELPVPKKKKVQFSNTDIKKKGDGDAKTKKKVEKKVHSKPVTAKMGLKGFKGKDQFKTKNKNGPVHKDTDAKGSKDKEQPEKPKWSEMKKEKKELRLKRRKAKATESVFEISHKAKLLAAQIQRKVVKQDFKQNACKELHGILKGQYKQIALTHDLSRVIQVLLKHSDADIRNEISEELLDIVTQMVQSKYGQHSMKRILKYGTDFIRHEVIKKFLGSIVTLAAHTISAPVLDYAYGEFASQKEKLYMQQEFYGDIYKNTKDDNVKTLSDTYKNSPEMKSAILSSCKANIQRILDKNLHDSELLHTVLYDFIQECSAEDRAELITTLSPLIVPLSNSLPGVNTASICVWQGSNKDKKAILKVVKEHAVPLSVHKTGYRLLIAIFDSVDDTVLVKKMIVSALTSSLKDVAKDHWGKLTLHWLVKPSDTAAFHPSFVKFLKDGAKTGTSKKDTEIRVAELHEAIVAPLLDDIQTDPEFWLKDPTVTLLTTAVLSVQSSKEALDAVAKALCRPGWRLDSNEKMLAIEDPGMHMCLKKMATLDKDRSGHTFGKAILEHITSDTFEAWLTKNRGCFLLLKLLENNTKEVASDISKRISSHRSILKNQSTQGAKLLLQHLDKK